MDKQVREAIKEHQDYQRLKEVFPLEFLVECFTNPRRGYNGSARWVGSLLKDHGSDPTLFVSGVHYHELVEMETFKKLGYSDNQLGDNKTSDPNYKSADMIAKRKEFEFYQHVANVIENVKPPFLAWSFSHLAVTIDFGMRAPPFDVFYRIIEERGFDFYDGTFTMPEVKTCIGILKRGGDLCSGKSTSQDYANEYLSGRKPAPKVEPWNL